MAPDALSSLLEEMLEESQLEPDVEPDPRTGASAPQDPDSGTSIAGLGPMATADLRKILVAVAPDDLLVVLASCPIELARRILGCLDEGSVRWMRDNLAHMGEVNDHERGAAEERVLEVVRRLLAEGEITGAAERPMPRVADTADGELHALLTELVRAAGEFGVAAVTGLTVSAGEPLLDHGLALVADGVEAPALRAALDAHEADLIARYAERLGWMREAIVGIREGETAEAFQARVFGAVPDGD